MREDRRRRTEGPEQQDVLGRVREMVLAADDVADGHGDVVDDDREVVERRAVGADDDEVAAEDARVDADHAPHDVAEVDDALADAEADRRAAALGAECATLVGRQVARSGRCSEAPGSGPAWARSAASSSGVQKHS